MTYTTAPSHVKETIMVIDLFLGKAVMTIPLKITLNPWSNRYFGNTQNRSNGRTINAWDLNKMNRMESEYE